jgi:hypothetical protein
MSTLGSHTMNRQTDGKNNIFLDSLTYGQGSTTKEYSITPQFSVNTYPSSIINFVAGYDSLLLTFCHGKISSPMK